ncbi:MAG: hypothetical protein ACHQF3_10815 [Alphaproteobacteria bacterium]
MTVFMTLDIFSGRPNPRWALAAGEASSLAERLAALPRKEGAEAEPPGLGYRGLLVEFAEGPRIETPVRVYRGSVLRGVVRFADPGRTLERWLLETGRNAIPPELAAALRDEFEAR